MFVSTAKLSGYKSIKKLEVTFNSGLNIIIGKNATGKTNFLTFLYRVLNLEYDNLPLLNISSETVLNSEDKEIQLSYSTKENVIDALRSNKLPNKNGKTRLAINKVDQGFLEDIDGFDPDYRVTFVGHGLPSNYEFIEKPFAFSIAKETGFCAMPFTSDKSLYHLYFIKSLLTLHFVTIEQITLDKIRQGLALIDTFLSTIKPSIIAATPIEDIKLDPDYRLLDDTANGDFKVSNLRLLFKVNGVWYEFDSLSDGTKRAYYIASEVLTPSNFFAYYHQSINHIKRLILIEEPELAIHPHQLKKLMDLIKVIAKEHQVIMTTHSPIALDVLGKKDLDSILISEMKGVEGTQIRHLTSEEKQKALLYMEEDYLSDYWKYSDLES